MTLILPSPPIDPGEITRWSRNLLDNDVTIDNIARFKVVEILQFQILPAAEGQIRVLALVKLFGPLRQEAAQDG